MSVQALTLSPDRLTVAWADGEFTLGAATLRAACRCAPCQAARLRGAPDTAADGVTLLDARPVGHYAVQLVFSDGHERGIFPWPYLEALSGRGITTAAAGSPLG